MSAVFTARKMSALQNNESCTQNNEVIQKRSVFKENYERQLHEFYVSQADSMYNVKKPWTSARILEVIDIIKNSRMSSQRAPVDYYWTSKYHVMETEDRDILVFKRRYDYDATARIVATDEYFDILTEVHNAVGHGGRDKMMHSIKDRLYIPKKAIEIYVKLCAVCEMKRPLPKKIVTKPRDPGINIKAPISRDFNTRGHINLIDFRSAVDGEYKWLMNYQDHATKFSHLRPLKSKKPAELAFELLKIFLEFGAPLILQFDSGTEFTDSVIKEILQLWPECKIVHGGLPIQGTVEGSNQDVENMLRCWMNDNHSVNWSVGCYFVQYYKNSSLHRIIGRSPYRALFGSDPKTILKGTNIPDSVIHSNSDGEQ